jgi:hypothetical protein
MMCSFYDPEKYQQNHEEDAIIQPQFYQESMKIDARKNYAKVMAKLWKMDPNRGPNFGNKSLQSATQETI